MEKMSKSNPDKTIEPLVCPKCGKRMYPFYLGRKCSNKECTFWIPREIRQKVLTDEIMKELVENRETGFIHGFHKRGYSQTFGARLYISENWKIKFRLNDESDIKCPKCNAKMVVRFERGYRCEDEEKCGFILWNRFGGKQLTEEQMVMLLTERKTGVIKGFISKKNGKKYSARIVISEEGALRVNFDDKKVYKEAG